MRRNTVLTFTTMALVMAALFTTAACKTSGMAMTSRGQFFKININAPERLAEGAESNVDVDLSNRGVNNLQDILADVEFPSQIIVLDQTSDRGITAMHDPGSSVYHFSLGNLQPGEDAHIRFKVRTAFGNVSETGKISVTAWQKDLPGDKLFRKTTIALQR
jgi:hypothetical protein